MRVVIRPFDPKDAEAVQAVHNAAFDGREDEARLVRQLHAAGATPVSLVGVDEDSGSVAGHVLFSPVEIEGDEPVAGILGLAPIGVLPEYQGRGVGSQLIRAGLEACRDAGYGMVVLLGDPGYYSRFGFVRAGNYGLGNEYGADEHFMVLELKRGTLDGSGGTVRYRPEFGRID